MHFLAPLLVLASLLPTALSWGAAGHEIVATIAQIHLHPSTRSKLCGILPPEAKCHLAPIAAWADQVRNRYRGTAPMHYVNGRGDHPQDHCEFGEHGWMNEDVNVLTAIANMTALVADGKGDIPLRFLVHFMGDLHQPLHLTGRDKGGNGAMFLFEGRHRNLHSVWDSGLITKSIRELGNYTSPVPSKQIESSLPGAIFDPYVRFIVWELLRKYWTSDIETWLACPAEGDPYPHSSVQPDIPSSTVSILHTFRQASSLVLNLLPGHLSAMLDLSFHIPLAETQNFSDALLALHPNASASSAAARQNQTKAVVCPYTWGKTLQPINCQVAWPAEYQEGGELIELDTPEYVGKIKGDLVVEKLLAMGGLRLASVLNQVYADEVDAQGGDLFFGY